MGGCFWDYFVPYDDDVGTALQKLRNEVFRTGKYSHSRIDPSDEDLEELPDLAEEEPVKEPESIEELLEQEAENGTNSILDITHVSEEPEFSAVSPMPPERIYEIFGTEKPTREMVEGKRGYPELTDENPLANEGWRGAYFTVYRDGKPDEIYFVGSSGDH
jgi:hypothetical protein